MNAERSWIEILIAITAGFVAGFLLDLVGLLDWPTVEFVHSIFGGIL